MASDHQDQPLQGKRAAVAVGPLYEEIEALYPLYRLREAGATVEVIGLEAGATVPGKRGDEIQVDRAAGDLSAGDLDLLVVAGGYGPDKLRMDDGLLGLVRELDEQGTPIAFICHGGWVPASAGIVAGRRVTGNPAIEDDMRNAGAEWEDSEVVVDGHLVSSRKPDDLPAFLTAIIGVVARAPAPA
ncbi:MAG TPA: type 1 glutamine amidotransferase domain-containing protein [Solirubrobacteraceae bacterium]|nr:type 1 glutamine amidotransferase domain-containing protein [Solirubrobacteraceae bacterium]